MTMKIATSIERLNELFDSDPRNDKDIAAELGVSKQTMSSWRNGRRSPKKPTMIEICKKFDVSIEWLMGFDVPRNYTEMEIKLPDAGIIGKVIIQMAKLFPEDYYNVVKALEKTEIELRKRGEL